MPTCFRLALVAAALMVVDGGRADAAFITFTDRSAFAAALAGRNGFEDGFNELTYGATATSDTISALGLTATYTAPNGGLFGLNGALSTFTATNPLVITLAGGVHAVGGTFVLTDVNGFLSSLAPGQTVVATAYNGSDPPSTLTSSTNTPGTFFGWISSTPLQRVISSGGGLAPTRWNTIDAMIYAGPAPVSVPAPLPIAGLAAAFGWSRQLRRRLKG